MLVIADAAAPQAVAGVMGGAVVGGLRPARADRASRARTSSPPSVRRTSKRLGLKTEASSRFERGADINAPVVAPRARVRAARADRRRPPRGRRHRRATRRRAARVDDSRSAAPGSRTCSAPPSTTPRSARILAGLGLRRGRRRRTAGDVTRPDDARRRARARSDLIEEVARHHGYDRLPSHFPRPARRAGARPSRGSRARRLLRHVLAAAGFSEAVTFSFIERARRRAVRRSRRGARRRSPTRCRRSSPCCGRRCCPAWSTRVAHNRRHDTRDVRLFEIGACFTAARGERRARRLRLDRRRRGRTLERRRTRPSTSSTPRAWSSGIGEALRPAADLRRGRTPVPACRAAPRRCARGATRRSASSGQLLPGASPRPADLPGADEVYVAELDLDAIGGWRRPTTRRSEAAAPLPVDRARHLDRRRRHLARRAASRDHPRGRRRRRSPRCASSTATRARASRTAASACRCGSRSGRRIAR